MDEPLASSPSIPECLRAIDPKAATILDEYWPLDLRCPICDVLGLPYGTSLRVLLSLRITLVTHHALLY